MQLLNSQLTYYVRGDESRRAQNTIIEFAISLKTRKRNHFTAHLNVGLWYPVTLVACGLSSLYYTQMTQCCQWRLFLWGAVT